MMQFTARVTMGLSSKDESCATASKLTPSSGLFGRVCRYREHTGCSPQSACESADAQTARRSSLRVRGGIF